ncbi:Septin-9 [Orbilia brochopaga]|nr:Septin-9 [Drechslerella brochopaga]
MMMMQAPSHPPPPPPAEEIGHMHHHHGRPVTPHNGTSPLGRLTVPKNSSKASANGSAVDLSKSPSQAPPPQEQTPPPPRRSSLGNLLRRSRSNDKMSKKIKKNQPAAPPPVPQAAPKLPELDIAKGGSTPMRSFGGPSSASDYHSHNHPTSPANSGPKPSMDLPSRGTDPGDKQDSTKAGFDVSQDPYQNQSITNRGRYSYASSAVSTIHGPRRLRKRKDPIPFNVLVIGARGSGKSSFVQFLKYSLANSGKPHKKGVANGGPLFSYTEDLEDPQVPNFEPDTGAFKKSYIETDIDGERVGITIWDSDGLEKSVVDLQMREIVAFIENKFEETFTEEMRVSRIPGNKDSHIHCTFLLMDPSRLDAGVSKSIRRGPKSTKETDHEGLDEDLDLQVFRALNGKTTVIPIIAKADTCTLSQMSQLKGLVVKSLHTSRIDPLSNLELDLDYSPAAIAKTSGSTLQRPKKARKNALPETSEESDEDESTGSDEESEAGSESLYNIPAISIIPFSVISPDHYSSEFVGRQYAWGVADPCNQSHCDFVKLKEAVFTDWRGDLRESSREVWYENWRTSRLSKTGGRQTNGRGH